MTRRLALLRMLGLLPATRYGSMGQMHRRPDQQTDAPPTAVAPTQAAGTLRARTVIIFGSGSHVGLFVYNGTPAKGNLVAAITPPGVTSDAFGNSIPTSGVFNAGTWNASGTLTSHYGVNNTGDTFLANTAGLTVVHERSSDGSVFFYSTSGEGVGNLLGSIAPAATTDGPGNTVVKGFASYGSGVAASLSNVQLQFFALTGGPANAPHVTSNTALATGTTLDMSSGSGTLAANQLAAAFYDSLQSAFGVAQAVIASRAGSIGTSPPPATNALLEIQGSQALKGIATPGSPAAGNALLFSDTNGFERMLAGLAGDTNAYQIGEIVLTSGGFTINSTTPQTILSCPVGIGTYVIQVWFVVANTTPGDAAGWAFTGPSAGVQTVAFENLTGGVSFTGSSTYTTTFNSQAVAGNQDIQMRALVAFTAAGTLAITGKELVAANTVTVFGGWMRVRHVS